MLLIERHLMYGNNPMFDKLSYYCNVSKKLYNSVNYQQRANFLIMGNDLMDFSALDKFVKTIPAKEFYYDMPNTKVAQQTLKKLSEDWKGFISARKSYDRGGKNFKGIPKPPAYKKNKIGFELHFTNQASKIEGDHLYLTKSTLGDFKLKTKVLKEQYVYTKVIPVNSYTFEILIGYEVETLNPIQTTNFAAIDLGVNNLATLTFTNNTPLIINGKPVKSINQYYNKLLSKTQTLDLNPIYREKLCVKRNNKINDYLHKASHYIVKQLVSNNINTLVIGKNNGWKQATKMGNVTNQNFVQIPYYKLIQMLTYKCLLKGIKVVVTQESYTSKCSFLDKDEIRYHEKYSGKRIKRGLYKSKNGILINADVNGSYNIMRKYLKEVEDIDIYDIINSIEVCSTPLVYTVRFN